MNLPDTLLPFNLLWAANVLVGFLLVYAIKIAPWHYLQKDGLMHLFFGFVVALMLIWSVRAGIRPGLNFHLIGATVLTLMFGWPLALVALAIVLLGITVFDMAGWQSLGINFFLMAGLPVIFSTALFKWADRKLPNHLFIYIFVCGFASAGLSIALCGLVATIVLSESGAYSWQYLTQNYLPYFILMAWSEALLTGMAVTLMAVYKPDWLITFNDTRYLKVKNKKAGD